LVNMNRHRSNWSAMGAGLTGPPSVSTLTSKEDCKTILIELFKTPHQRDQLTNIIDALREIKEELDI